MNIEQRAIADLHPSGLNYNRHGPEQVGRLAESLRAHGQQKPIVIQEDGTILAGHGLVEAAKHLGWTEIACHVYDGQHPEAFLAADNYLATLAEPDEAALADLLGRLNEAGELLASGYYEGELEELRARVAAGSPTKQRPEPPLTESWYVIVECGDENDQRHVLEFAQEKGWKCRALLS